MDKAELLEYLRIVEMKMTQLQRDIRNIRGALEEMDVMPKKQPPVVNFFTACRTDDDALIPCAPTPTARQ